MIMPSFSHKIGKFFLSLIVKENCLNELENTLILRWYKRSKSYDVVLRYLQEGIRE